jgi:hypothetical protein
MWSEPAIHDDQRIADLWRGRLLAARNKYALAVAESQIASPDFMAGTLPIPDGGANRAYALRAEASARDEYMRVLQVFTDLVLRGKRPEE